VARLQLIAQTMGLSPEEASERWGIRYSQWDTYALCRRNEPEEAICKALADYELWLDTVTNLVKLVENAAITGGALVWPSFGHTKDLNTYRPAFEGYTAKSYNKALAKAWLDTRHLHQFSDEPACEVHIVPLNPHFADLFLARNPGKTWKDWLNDEAFRRSEIKAVNHG
jgi:hypothetical protein